MNTDKQVFEAIAAEFKKNPLLYYTRLELHVQDGVVTVSGRVNSFAERKAVERAAMRVSGFKTLILEIRAAAIPAVVSKIPADAAEDATTDTGAAALMG